jgi:hypothetical protein
MFGYLVPGYRLGGDGVAQLTLPLGEPALGGECFGANLGAVGYLWTRSVLQQKRECIAKLASCMLTLIALQLLIAYNRYSQPKEGNTFTEWYSYRI